MTEAVQLNRLLRGVRWGDSPPPPAPLLKKAAATPPRQELLAHVDGFSDFFK